MAFRSFASERFWQDLKQVGEVWTARVGRSHRVIGYRDGDAFYWAWIGSHEAYNKLLQRTK